MKTYTRVLTIAGSDSGGGAGIQADLKTFSALGCYGASVMTALTAQNTKQVFSISPLSPQFVQEQLEMVLSDIGADAVKIGMLFSPEIIYEVAQTLKAYGIQKIVLDPVMVAKSGDTLLQAEAISAMIEQLFPLVHVITPNLPEASIFLQTSIRTMVDMEKASQQLAQLGPPIVVLKGGHLSQTEVDGSPDCVYLKNQQQIKWIQGSRISTVNTHGTGCTFSSAIAAYWALGEPILSAITKAKSYLSCAIQTGSTYQIGQGHGPVHHFFPWW